MDAPKPDKPQALDDLIATELNPVRNAVISVESAVSQDATNTAVLKAYAATSRLLEDTETMLDRLVTEIRRREIW